MAWPRLLASTLASGSIAAAAAGAVSVQCAYYREDRGPHYRWNEGAAALAGFGRKNHRAGIFRVYLHNSGSQPVPAAVTGVNGTPPAKLRSKERHWLVWWRVWPNPIPANGCAEVSLRVRTTPAAPLRLNLRLGKRSRQITIRPQDPGLRIGAVAWQPRTGGGTEITLVAVKTASGPMRLQRIWLDGRDLTAAARMGAPRFFHGVCPVSLRVPRKLPPGSFHTYRLETSDGKNAACTLRTLEDSLRLGMYGAGDLERDVLLGINTAAHFHPLDRNTLDAYAAFDRRAAFHVPIPPRTVAGHPAVYAFLLHDEPDCWDYGAKDWPPPLRIGCHAPDIVRDTAKFVQAAPTKPVMMTLDLTFKPANYYTYAQIPDIVAPDCYPLTLGWRPSRVREVVETCRWAAGPRRVEAIVQVDFEDRHRQKMKFRRPPFAGEVTLQYLGALAAGARGFSGWEWFDEDDPGTRFHGAPNYPDVLDAVRRIYRRFSAVAPLILRAYPLLPAHCADPKVRVQTLACGLDSLLIVAVNQDYQSLPRDFMVHPRHNLQIEIPAIPWLRLRQIARVDSDGRFTPLPARIDKRGARFTLPELRTGALLVAAAQPDQLRRLSRRLQETLAADGTALIRGAAKTLRNKARRAAIERLLAGRFARRAVSPSTLFHAYGVADKTFWNPKHEKYSGIEWWTRQTPRGAEWKVAIPAKDSDRPYALFFQTRRWWGGGFLRIELRREDGSLLHTLDRPSISGPVPRVPLQFPGPGTYRIRILQAGKGKPGGRLAQTIFLVPETALPAGWPLSQTKGGAP